MKKLLIEMLNIYNPSSKEEAITKYIINFLKSNNIQYYIDKANNIYNFQYNNKPFLNAHIDSVKTPSDEKILITEDLFTIGSVKNIIGGDDLNGVAIILTMLKEKKYQFNWILTSQEEIGGIGAKAFLKNNQKLIEKCSYGLVLDRRGNSDIICSMNSYGVEEFQQELATIGKQFNYSPARGLWSDADIWSDAISCANLSVGYYEPHSTNEFIVYEDVVKAKEFTESILTNITKKFDKPDKILYNDYSYEDYQFCDICNSMENNYFIESLGITLCKECAEYTHLELSMLFEKENNNKSKKRNKKKSSHLYNSWEFYDDFDDTFFK